MATTRRIVDASEKPVKGWQLEATQKQVDALEKLTTSFDTKLDQIITLLNSRPTVAEVDAKIELAVKNAVEKQDLKYAPIVSTNKKLLWAVIGSGIGLIASLIVLIIGIAAK